MYIFNSSKYSRIEIFLKSKENSQSKIIIKEENQIAYEECGGNGYYKLLKFDLRRNTNYQIEFIASIISISYLCGNDDILDKGICFLDFGNNLKMYDSHCLKNFYDTAYREQYHFNAFKNWINDPNGLCWYKGYYHMYYQANPHAQAWDNMYWGHAVSKDLIHWLHLPYALEPQQELLQNKDLKGGAFSGSAVVLDDKIVFYLTRHIANCKQTVEYQTMTSSKDSIDFDEETKIIEYPNKDVASDFRDPKVFNFENKWHMVLGSKLKNIPSILHYISNDMKNWEYIGSLLEETTEGVSTIECPDLMEIGNKFVAVASLMSYTDKNGRIQPTKYYIGNLQDNKLIVENTGLYDFGTNFYAVQSFEHNGRRISIGWISDFYNEHRIIENGSCGSMSIPRELSIKNNNLYMKPIKEIYTLKDKLLANVTKNNLKLEEVEGNSYYANIKLNKQTDFDILLCGDNNSNIELIKKGNITELKTKGVNSEKVRFIANVNEVSSIEIFVDRRTVEVFINDGEAAGTKLFYTDNKNGVFKTNFYDIEAVQNIEVYSMKSTW